MKDYLNALIERVKAPGFVKSLVDHNRGMFVALVIAGIVAVVGLGCQPKITSPLSGKSVTRDQLDSELTIAKRDLEGKVAEAAKEAANLKDRAGPAYAELERKEAAAQGAIAIIDGLIQQNVPAPFSGVAGMALSAVLLGLGIDNRRKDAVIAATKVSAPPVTPPAG